MELSPVVLFVYQRLDHTRQTVEALQENRLASDTVLFIYSDAARDKSTIQSVNDVRLYLPTIQGFKAVKIIERKENWGLEKSITMGIDEIVNKYGKVIVLEDDCVPSKDFLHFCNQSLQYHSEHKEVKMIAGGSYCPIDYSKEFDSYYFSRYMYTWGWATWKRSWNEIDFEISKWPSYRDTGKLTNVLETLSERFFWKGVFNRMYSGLDSKHWDYAFLLSSFMKNGLCVVPTKNLITNTGFGKDATHTKSKKRQQGLAHEELSFPLKHPVNRSANKKHDAWAANNLYGRRGVGWGIVMIKNMLHYIGIKK